MKKLFRFNLILSAVIGALALSSFTFSNDQDHTVLLPDPFYCNIVYSMSNGVPIRLYCPDGLCFNDKIDVCDWPQYVHPGRGCNRLTM